MTATLRACLTTLALLALAPPAAAQWTRVLEVPADDVFAVSVNGDTITAAMDTTVFISTNAGATWSHSTKPTAGVGFIAAARIRNGRLYAGTSGQGVFISDDLGGTWQAFNQGLVGGILNSQLDISELQVLDDKLYAATFGAGVYVRNLAAADTWHHFGEEFEPNQASNVEALAVGGTRVLAGAGGNGSVFFRDPGDPEWTISWLNNVGLHPSWQVRSAVWNGSGWAVGTNVGVFHSVAGQEPWSFTNLGLGSILNSAFAARGRRLFAAFDIVGGAVIEQSADDGATWEVLEGLFGVFVYRMAMRGTDLYAGRIDGLWRRSTATVSVSGDVAPPGLRFALVGSQPVGNDLRFRFELPTAGSAAIEIFDVAGRRAAGRVQGSWPAGAHEVSWDARGLTPGVYLARLTAAGRHETVRVVRAR